ncbi:MAG TPA: RnfABCDGE type electron transport complex subunit D [Phycisphaerae bacterium]|nr:RnfABCDGE type electron transport complex subunit D [Phycisphaerae bacterium]HPS52782.1 RnfABCDGE type electron transport complex subunit D [Phycisphaerae bacterium]
MTEENKSNQADIEAAVVVMPSPHFKDKKSSTRRMMIDVLIGLSPLMLVALIIYRQFAVRQVVVCVAACMLAELVFMKMRKLPLTLSDCSAAVTGVILAFSIPWNTPCYVAIIGCVVAIGIGKVIFGGVGMNLFNPAMVGRAFIMLAFAGALGAPGYVKDLDKMPWLASLNATPSQYAAIVPAGTMPDAVSAATPMTAAKDYQTSGGKKGFIPKLSNLFWGNHIGSLGEISAIACILGGAYLLIRRTASWQVPLGVILAVIIISGLRDILNPSDPWNVMHSLCGGALLFGAFFIATDPVTNPMTAKGKFIFGLGVGGCIELIRIMSGYPEGVMFAILLMNAVVPLINRWTVPKPFGTSK